MTVRKKLELDLNVLTEVEFLFDEPIIGESQYGNYYLYAVSVQGKEYSFFPPETLHEQLKGMKKGSKATIVKVAEQKGSRLVTRYEVKSLKTVEVPKEEPATVAAAADPIPEPERKPLEVTKTDNFYEVMLQSYRDALRIQQELNGLADPARIAITLFIARSRMPYSAASQN